MSEQGYIFADRIDGTGAGSVLFAGATFRIAGIVPAPSSAIVLVCASVTLARRRRG